jgi:hypothetical protein
VCPQYRSQWEDDEELPNDGTYTNASGIMTAVDVLHISVCGGYVIRGL